MLSRQPGALVCYYQSAFYQISHFGSSVIDVSTTDNMIVVVTNEGGAWIMEFNPEKILSGELNPTKINIKEKCLSVFMNYGDIFLQSQSSAVYHLKRNQWYQTKTYSDPVRVQGLEGKNIKAIVPALNHNYFLTIQGELYTNIKNQPTLARPANLQINFIAITAADYFIGIAKNGRLYIWGKYNDQNYLVPTQFGKLAQQFKSVNLSAENGFAVTVQGEGWIWGKNASGELGISDYEPRNNPFPLITMDKQKIRDIYIGEGYTICTVQSSLNKQAKFANRAMKNKTEFQKTESGQKPPINERSKKKLKDESIQVQQMISNKKEKKNKINESISLQMRDFNKSTKNRDDSVKFVATQVIRKSELKKNKTNEKTPQKSFEKQVNRSKSPISNYSNSKSPISRNKKSPYLQHLNNRSFSNLKKKKQFHDTRSLVKDSTSPNNKTQYKDKLTELQIQNNKLSQIMKEKDMQNQIKFRDLEQENTKLKKVISIKQNIIQDITGKIKLLQDAIQEHQRSLTARDNLMEQYQRRQKQYQIHIDQLQKNIQDMIKGQNSAKPKPQDCYNEMYKNLKLQLFKQKDYFMQKMSQYEELLKNQRSYFKQKIRFLEEQIQTHRSRRDQTDLISSRNQRKNILVDRQNQRMNKQNVQDPKPFDQNAVKMSFIISRIEDSKVRIAKSVTKVYQMIDDKQ